LDAIPESWPTDEEQRRKPIVPLFPLPNVWLFPGAILPLQIFESRYKQMIEDCLDGPGRIVMGTVVQGAEDDLSGSPPCYPIAGLGEIGRHERLPDGRFHIFLVGLARVQIEEVDSGRLYRQVRVHRLDEIQADRGTSVELDEKLREAISVRTEDLPEIPDGLSIGRLADILLLRTPLPHPVLNGLYGELDVAARARSALAEHARRPMLDDETEPQADDDSMPDLPDDAGRTDGDG